MALWQPTDLGSKLRYWVNADDHGTVNMTDDGAGVISLWRDRIGGMAATAVTTARGTWSATAFNTSYAAIAVDPSVAGQAYTSTALGTIPTGSTPCVMFAVASNNDTTAARTLWRYGSGTAGVDRFLNKSSSNRLQVGDGTSSLVDTLVTFTGPHLILAHFQGGTLVSARMNGSDTSPASSSSFATLATAATRFRLFGGASASLTSPYNGAGRHFIIATGVTQAEIEQLEGWGAWDSGLVAKLPAGHTYKSAAPTTDYALINVSGQTRLGDMTSLGGLAKAFDGVTDATGTTEAAGKSITSAQDAYCGTRLATPKRIGKAIAYGTNNLGFIVTNVSTTLALYGKLGSDPANSTDGTLLSTYTFTDTADERFGRHLIVTDTGVYDRVWIRATHADATARNTAFVELQFYERPSIFGDLDADESGNDTAAFDGTVEPAGPTDVTGDLAATETGADTAAAAGNVTVTGNLAAAETGSDTAAIAGAVAIAGSLAVTETGADTAAISGAVKVSGSLAVTEAGADTAAISAGLIATGSLAAQEVGSDTFASTGTSLPIVVGSLAAQEVGADTAAATGTLGPLPLFGSMAASEVGTDSASLTGNVAVGGSLALAEIGADTLAASGTVTVAASLAATELGNDNAAVSGGVVITGSLAAQETGNDTAAISSKAVVTGALAVTEVGSDVAAVAGSVLVSGTLAAPEVGADTAAVVGVVTGTGNLAATEVGADTAAFSGVVHRMGTLAAQETGTDTAAIVAKAIVTGNLAGQETGSDTAAFSGTLGMLMLFGSMAAQETGADAAAISGKVPIAGTLAALETGQDVLAVSAKALVKGALAVQEIGDDVTDIDVTVTTKGTMDAHETGVDSAEIFVRTLPRDSAATIEGSLNAPIVLTGQSAVVIPLRGTLPSPVHLKGSKQGPIVLRGSTSKIKLKGSTGAY